MKMVFIVFIILNIHSYCQSKYFPLNVGNYWQYKVTYNSSLSDTPEVTYDYIKVLGDTLLGRQQKLFKIVRSVEIAPYFTDTLQYLRYDSVANSINMYSIIDDSETVLFKFNANTNECWRTLWIEMCYFGLDTMNIFEASRMVKTFYGGSIPSFYYELAEDIGPAKIIDDQSYTITSTFVYDLIYAKIDGIGYGNLVHVSKENSGLPNNFYLSQNYPNPFNPATKIKYSLPKTSFVTLKLYDILGKEIATLVNEEKPAGNYEVIFIGSNYPSGIYFYRIQAGSYSSVKKMILLK